MRVVEMVGLTTIRAYRTPMPSRPDMIALFPTRPDLRRAIAWGVALAGLWLVVAPAQPTTTFHLAPLLVSAAPPILLVIDDQSTIDRRDATRAAIGGGAIALAATMTIAAIGGMQGPSFAALGSPPVEAVVFTFLGTAIGLGVAGIRTTDQRPAAARRASRSATDVTP
jgi:hypothetical protein